MQIQAVEGNSPTFGMKCPARVKQKILECMTSDGPSFFKNSHNAAKKVESIGSSSTNLTSVKFVRDFWDNGESAGALDTCFLTFKLKSPNGKTETLTRQIQAHDASKIDLFRALFKVTKNTERDFIDSYLVKQAVKGQLQPASQCITELYPNHRGFVAFRIKQLESVNTFATSVKTQFAGIKEFCKKLFK